MSRDIGQEFHYGVCEITESPDKKSIKDIWAAHRDDELILWFEDRIPETSHVKPNYFCAGNEITYRGPMGMDVAATYDPDRAAFVYLRRDNQAGLRLEIAA